MSAPVVRPFPSRVTILKPDDWPALDRRLWLAACAPMDILEGDGGSRSNHRAISNFKVTRSVGRWLSFLVEHCELDPNVPPAQRITIARVKAYVADLKQRGNATQTVINRLEDLRSFALAVDVTFDPRFITRISSRIRASGPPGKDKRIRLVPTNDLLDLGIRLMAEASARHTPLQSALTFRDGLLIAFLALRPLRLRNLTHLQLGVSRVRAANTWVLNVPGAETKNGSAFEAPWPDVLHDCLETYLAIHRPVLATFCSSKESSDALWLGRSSPLHDGGVNLIVCKRTRAAFGRAINPHAFRHAAATSWAIMDPTHVRGAASLLGHRSQGTTERHYQLAQGLEAHREFAASLGERRMIGRKMHPTRANNWPPKLGNS